MPKLTNKTIRYGLMDGRTDGLTDPNYRKASLLKIQILQRQKNQNVSLMQITKLRKSFFNSYFSHRIIYGFPRI